MARHFNGTTDWAQVQVDLSAYSVISVSYWLNIDRSNVSSIVLEHGPAYDIGESFLSFNTASIPSLWEMGFHALIGHNTLDTYPMPPADINAWHHYLLVINLTVPSNQAYIDGVAQSMTPLVHTGGGTLFPNQPLNVMARNAGELGWCQGSIADLAVWGGVTLGTNEAAGMTMGMNPVAYTPASIVGWWTLDGGSSPEPNSYGPSGSMTVSGAIQVPGPFDPVTSILRPARRRSRSASW